MPADTKYIQDYRARNPEYRDRQNELAKAYHKTLRGKIALKASIVNRLWAQRGGLEKITADELFTVWKKHGGKHRDGLIINEPLCAKCNISLSTFGKSGFFVDHVIALCFGGKNEKSNIQFLCCDCNARKTSEERKRHTIEKRRQNNT